MVCIANSTIISDLKKAVIKEIINDEALFYAIDSPSVKDVECADELVYKNIFPYHQNPETLTEVQTFLTIQVHIPGIYSRNEIWIQPTLEIWIISHQSHMKVDNIPKITDNRNDYISKLLDNKFNGRNTLGGSNNDRYNLHLYGELQLTSNVEGAFSKEYIYRRLIFETKDINNSLCDR